MKGPLKFAKLFQKDQRFLPNLSMALNGLGYALLAEGDFLKAIIVFKEALNFYRKYSYLTKEWGLDADLSWNLNGLGYAYLCKGDLFEARSSLNEALKIRKEFASRNMFLVPLANTLKAMGYALLGTNDLESAISHLNQAIEIYREEVKKNSQAGAELAESYVIISDCYCLKGDVESLFTNLASAERTINNLLNDKSFGRITKLTRLTCLIADLRNKCLTYADIQAFLAKGVL
jgi:tetratricopeptide (TPR) repeat protein